MGLLQALGNIAQDFIDYNPNTNTSGRSRAHNEFEQLKMRASQNASYIIEAGGGPAEVQQAYRPVLEFYTSHERFFSANNEEQVGAAFDKAVEILAAGLFAIEMDETHKEATTKKAALMVKEQIDAGLALIQPAR